jgi:hypothetical protein
MKSRNFYSSALPLHVQAGLMARASGKAGANPLALAMMLPEHSAIRLPTTDIPRSSVMVSKDQMTITTANATPAGWNSGDLLLAVYGQPGRTFAAYTTLPTGGYSSLKFGQGESTWTLETAAMTGSITLNQDWPLVGATTGSGTCPHGPSMPIGISQNVGFVFMNVGDTLAVYSTTYTSTGLTNAGAVFQVFKWKDDGSEPTLAKQTTITMNATSFSDFILTATEAAHYSVKFVGFYWSAGSVTSTNTGVTINLGYNATAGWMIRGMGDIDINNAGDFNLAVNCRRNGFSLLASNTTSVLNRQGTVVAARVKDNDFTAMTPAFLARTGEKYTGDAAKGVYTFMEFTEAGEKFAGSVSAANLPVYDLDTQDYYHFIQITCPGVASAPNTYTVTLATNLEFKTEVARYPKAVSYHKFDLLLEARGLVNSTPDWFFENPDHMRRVYALAKAAFHNAVRVAPLIAEPAARIAGTLHPAGAPAYEALARLLRGMTV